MSTKPYAALGDGLGLAEPDGLTLPLALGDTELDGLTEPDGLTEAEALGLALALGERPVGVALL